MGAAPPVLLWLRRDLRLADHPALTHALSEGRPVIPVFIWAPEEEAPWQPGAASRWWLHHSLAALGASVQSLGSRLILREGDSLETLRALTRQTGAGAVYWTRRYEPAVVARDARVKAALRADGLTAHSFSGALINEPGTIANGSGLPYRVFTPFWKRCLREGAPAAPLPAPGALPPVDPELTSLPLAQLGLLPTRDWAAGFGEAWTPGEAGASSRLAGFTRGPVTGYADGRDLPDRDGTARLSPHLTFGEVSPRQLWHRVVTEVGEVGAAAWTRQLYWREFAHHLLLHFPHTTDQPLDERFTRLPWLDAPEDLAAWQRGATGYPFIDAGMRQLWATGWMHNRVRMLVASFLTKDLLITWQEGARWFWDTLVDADLANNTMGWQWAAGCGADAAPFFRVFNPVLQGKRFDGDGRYTARWVPELAALSPKAMRAPWEAAPLELRAAGVDLGETYPEPLVDHRMARMAALEAYEAVKAPA